MKECSLLHITSFKKPADESNDFRLDDVIVSNVITRHLKVTRKF